jgi:hypothetical protein
MGRLRLPTPWRVEAPARDGQAFSALLAAFVLRQSRASNPLMPLTESRPVALDYQRHRIDQLAQEPPSGVPWPHARTLGRASGHRWWCCDR